MRQTMMRFMHNFSIVTVTLWCALTAADTRADILFESGTLGPTGVTYDDLLADTVGGTRIADVVFTGVRFELSQPVRTTHIGAHVLQRPGSNPNGDGSFFGAIIALDNENDFPNSGDLSTSDFLGSALLAFPDPSAEVFSDLSLRLEPGWYALVFGSALFGATANGAALRNNPDIGEPAYIAWQPHTSWFNLSDLSDAIEFVDHRFVVRGSVVPEPISIGSTLIGAMYLILNGRRLSRCNIERLR